MITESIVGYSGYEMKHHLDNALDAAQIHLFRDNYQYADNKGVMHGRKQYKVTVMVEEVA
jgi:hypothetical protein